MGYWLPQGSEEWSKSRSLLKVDPTGVLVRLIVEEGELRRTPRFFG